MIVRRFFLVYRRRSLKDKEMVLGEEEGLECEICVDGTKLAQAL